MVTKVINSEEMDRKRENLKAKRKLAGGFLKRVIGLKGDIGPISVFLNIFLDLVYSNHIVILTLLV